MSNDLHEIKKYILNENKVEELLLKMGCSNVRYRSNRYEAMLPDKFDSNNPRSVQVKLIESLSSSIRSRGLSKVDIYGLVSYIVFDCYSDDEINKNLYASKRWICNQLGLNDFLHYNGDTEEKEDHLQWLKDIKKQRNKKKRFEVEENEVYDDNILNQYVMYPYLEYINEGITYETQREFQVGFDVNSNRVIFPIYNSFGEIVSIKGRAIDPSYKEKGIPKFLYLYNFNKMIELYNWSNALYYILEKKEIIIFEGEKSCWLATQFGYRNCVAIAGDDLSEFQVQMIKNIGLEIKIIIAMDKDKSPNDIKKQAKKFGHARLIYALWDSRNLLDKEKKQSPVDAGQRTFDDLYEECFRHKINMEKL